MGLDEKTLVISKITVDEGPKLKRWRARSRGRAMQIQKKTSHINVELTGEKSKKKVEKKEEKKPEVKKEEVKEETKKEKKVVKPEIKKVEPKKGKANLKKVFRRKAF